MNKDELKSRTKSFALRVMKLTKALPCDLVGRTIANQLIRSATSVGANYRAACRSRSKAEFIARLGVVEEESDESVYWLELIIEGKIIKKTLVEPLFIEANELTAIFTAAIKSAKIPSPKS